MEENKVINSNFLQPRDAWDRLSLAEKAEMMKVAVNNGIFNLQDIRDKYNEFAEGGDTDSDEANTISLNEAKRMGVMVGLAPFTRQKGYIGGTPSEARDKYWQTDKEMRVLTDSVAGRYGISPDLLRSRMDQEGYTDSRIAEINHDAQKGTNRALLGEALFHSQAMPYVAGEEFGLDDVATYINDGTVKLINEKWGDGQGRNEKGRWTNLAMGYDYSDNVGIMAATLKAMRELARKDFPKASEADLDRYAQAYYNRGITGGRKWVQSGAKGYKINKHSIGGPLVDAVMNEYKNGGGIHIKPSHRGRLTELKKRTCKSEAELYRTGSPATRKMITFARNARKWKHGDGGNLFYPGGDITYGKPFYSYDDNGQLVKDEYGNPIINYNGNLSEIVIIPDRKPIGLDMLSKGINTNSNYTVGNAARKAGEDAVRERSRKVAEAAKRFNQHNEMYSIISTGEVSGLPTYKMVEDQKVIGMSGTDPIGSAFVLGTAMEPLFGVTKLLGKRVGSLISKNKYNPPIESKSLNTITDNEGTVPILEQYERVGKALQEARNYKTSEGYKALSARAGKESEDMGIGFFPSETFTDVITFSKREPNDLGGYNEGTNTVDIDLDQANPFTPFHEGLHWQFVGEPSHNIGPMYTKYREALRLGLPKDIRANLLKEHRKYPEEVQKLEYANRAMMYLRRKVDNVLMDDYPINGYMRNPKELQANGTETGKALGIEPFTPYPGYEEAVKVVKSARNYNKNLEHIKADTPKEVEDFWNIITGNYIPSIIGGSVVVNSLNND